MIGRLTGKVYEKTPPFFILDVSGIGYLIQSPLSTFKQIKEEEEITLYTKCIFKEDEAFIYGFLTREELKIFEELISVSGVGPKSGLNLLSSFSPEEISEAIENENVELLSSVPKIGKKIASKIILELKGKLKFDETPKLFTQAVNALCSLGISRSEALQRLKGLPQNLTLEELVKQALRK
ncbi:MAG TPA: Holliday junction branch migration protein RuvA [candidate division WOR-3 bacterium]|uniref:Holliday junction branch migration complex subunit RuvA n=1 Tax=candidate division WOR-3 bacterium TaxID=2052148 RepID=A0A9C9JZN0_UNCW3|nr:Holliday junction branch migration protein RuvA [candidate division WOR-3 bacterium]